MKIKISVFRNTLFMAMLGLIMSVFTAQAAPKPKPTPTPPIPPIPISSLPFNITAPGTYALTGNLPSPPLSNQNGVVGAINISPSIAGSVVVDLGGFTLTGPGWSGAFGISIAIVIGNEYGPHNTYPITIRNGTIQNFGTGVEPLSASDVTINNIVFNLADTSDSSAGVAGVFAGGDDSLIVSNCVFNANGPPTNNGINYGIIDYGTTGGNNYSNNTFSANFYSILVVSAGSGAQPGEHFTSPLVLERCQFAAPQ
jgi:hypothetical protein